MINTGGKKVEFTGNDTVHTDVFGCCFGYMVTLRGQLVSKLSIDIQSALSAQISAGVL